MCTRKKVDRNKMLVELKVFILLCYYVVLGVVVVASYTTTAGDTAVNNFSAELASYFLCEITGVIPGKVCSRQGFEAFINPAFSIAGYMLVGLYPVVNLIFAINFIDLWRCMHIRKQPQTVTSTNLQMSVQRDLELVTANVNALNEE